MTTGTVGTDKGVGLGLAFGILTIAAAAYTIFAPTQFSSALGFGAAITLAVLSVAALHVY